MAKFTILLSCDDDDYQLQLAQVDAWFAANADHIQSKSDDEGCGCCVNIWEVECDEALMASLPASSWSPRVG